MYTFVKADHLIIKRAGVYKLLLGIEIVYVGKSSHVPNRVMAHYSSRKIKFDHVEVHWCEIHEMDWVEEYHIRLHRPKHNKDLIDAPPLSNVKIDLAKLGLIVRTPLRRI